MYTYFKSSGKYSRKDKYLKGGDCFDLPPKSYLDNVGYISRRALCCHCGLSAGEHFCNGRCNCEVD